VAFDDSVDNFWADLLQFPDDFHQANCEMYKSALRQLRLGIRDGGSGCYRNEPLLSVTQYSTLSATIKWCAQHPANFTWLPVSIEVILKRSLQAIIPHVQQWNLLVAETMPSTEIRHNKKIPVADPTTRHGTRLARQSLSYARRFWSAHQIRTKTQIYCIFASKRLTALPVRCTPQTPNTKAVSFANGVWGC